jgi:hypothetical protein|tara:strand:+ start:145 stop:408 length:264 start_codon:yes stop_codon:yes gene_type:complete
VFLSPPWGGTGYQFLAEYSLDHIYPDFDQIVQKSLEFSHNLMFFLPKNTSVEEIIDRLLPYHEHLLGDQSATPVSMRKRNELVLEIE